MKKIKEIEERITLDIFYIDNWNLWLDIKIIFLTIGSLLKDDDKAYK